MRFQQVLEIIEEKGRRPPIYYTVGRTLEVDQPQRNLKPPIFIADRNQSGPRRASQFTVKSVLATQLLIKKKKPEGKLRNSIPRKPPKWSGTTRGRIRGKEVKSFPSAWVHFQRVAGR